ncbi:adenylate/guanylate cyclase domain-containing protein [Mycobacterium conspicuum]|jgi:pimeloyl-ACP methyl ester carboxylesterase/class 3 adenylate cyclase|uniref:Hydrolase n=1 Tax=Mycobacterium conspicuum TaxID=44010 RepID=A0A1X1T6N8_9MYCO|nr:adenylate/guanylate cyclase domain-containing protein [Mycobacterium conspicuum]ORV40190.1 hydrolase [Mycobacterium conspicuum]BBZ37065.1 hydrolase [Mycobacterium conspicuum]
MTDRRVRYARNGSVRLAYREFGQGDTTLVWNPGWFSNVDLADDPASPVAAVVEQLAEVTRVIVWDKRGTGLSDPATRVPPLDERMDDLHAVLDDAKVDRPAFFGMSEGGPMSVLFAATYPERVQSLVMYGVMARFSQELPDYPWGFTAQEKAKHLEAIESHWGDGVLAELFFGELANIPGFRDLYGRYQRTSASPTMATWLWQALLEIDVRGILGSIRAPTLVLARPGDQMASVEGARALAAGIPGSQFKTLPEGPHALVDDAVGSAILDFVCGTSSAAVDERVFKTVLFTDIVSSTELLSARGDAQWRRQLDAHDKAVDWLLEKYGGRRAKHTGDGVFALFDGPTKAARCALELIPALATRGLRIRAGVHTGECERRGDEWSGMAVHTGARIGALAGTGEVLASRTVRDLSAGSGLIFESLGAQHLKGLPEEVDVYRVTTPTGGPAS